MAARKEQAELAKKSILEATNTLIKEIGYENIRISDITTRCNMSPGNFYHYFKSKEEVFAELDTTNFYTTMSVFKTGCDLPVIERLELFFKEWISSALKNYGSEYSYHWVRYYSKKTSDATDDNIPNNRIYIIHNYILDILKTGIIKQELQENTPIETISFSIAFSIFGSSAYFGVTQNAVFYQQWSEDYCKLYISEFLKPYLRTNAK